MKCKLCQRQPTLNLNYDFVSCRNPDCPMDDVEMTQDEWELLNTDLQKENDELKRQLAIRDELLCKTCKGTGNVLIAPDDGMDCPECAQSLADIRAEAVMDYEASLSSFAWTAEEYIANKIKGAE